MKCPNCKMAIEVVKVYSQCYQNADVKGNKIVAFGEVEAIAETLGIECVNCGADIRNLIQED